ncbi:HD domain-containing phosphohydrolase [Deinococcus soli (ex Cha et al. 2016)]|uniref:PAS domain S-box-containing protein n=2 Tax=Deinococcus soli (ex Cha et al. 2016) TaxID=1309411 RepID=A0ACC6KL27_9DEIO|nr:HD domain-containing phosphohydrolase [Deinococcus soli (ex Cha et al. 2016)]MDR6218722.1 PAS domain S-box-containing protein [Deinococcus soli (ex Cha et al. 2016)]MDR6328519.1 PAS domain S-box-containing protein [Deinococcus soli (ex Cha et al. 2016)]MDR6753130.1 PAS domain S-box-containing protein [Deinococcus soli (ex Cha et al. 2016)]
MTQLPSSSDDPQAGPDRAALDRLLAHHHDLTLGVTLDGHVSYLSPAARRALPEARPGDLLSALVHPDDAPAFTGRLAALQDGGAVTLPPFRMGRADDWQHLSGHAALHRNDPLLPGVTVTVRPHAAQNQERRHQRLTRYGSDLVSVLNADTQLTFTTDATTQILGYPDGALLRRPVFGYIHPDDHGPVTQALAHLAQGGPDPVRLTFRFRHFDGHWVWIESIAANHFDDPDIGGILINSRDVSVTVQLQQELQRREEASRHLFERNPLPMWLYDRQTLAITDVNEAAAHKYGYSRGEFLNLTIRDLRPPEDEGVLTDILAGLPEGRVATTAAQHVLRGGTVIDVLSHGRTVTVGGRDLRLVVSEDVTTQNAAEAQRLAQMRRYQALLDLTEALAAARDPLELAREALQRCVDLTDCAGGVYVSIQGEHLETQHTHQLGEALTAYALRAPGHVSTLTGLAPGLAQGQAQFMPIDPDRLPPDMRAHTGPYRSMAALPVLARGQLLGAFVLFNPYPAFTADARRLLTTISEYASTAMDRSLHVAQLDASREETLRAMGLMLEYRDYETAGHTDRVVTLAERLGTQVQLPGSELDALRWGAYLHDTGKIAIPDRILLKPGRLDAAEWAAMQRHSEIGYELLSHVPNLPRSTLDVVLRHHERWDGSGYPSGLAGTAIPLPARLFALVDVYDALTDERPYKHAWSHDDALAEIERAAGTQFDPALTATFLTMMRALGPRTRPRGAELDR